MDEIWCMFLDLHLVHKYKTLRPKGITSCTPMTVGYITKEGKKTAFYKIYLTETIRN